MLISERYRPFTEMYSPEVLPEVIRHRFTRLLRVASVSYEGFHVLTDEQMISPLFLQSDTPLKQLRHIVMHTFASVAVMSQATKDNPGVLDSWNYTQQFPGLQKVETMDREGLLFLFGETLGALHRVLQKPGILSCSIKKPVEPGEWVILPVADALGDLSEHFYLHAQNMIDYYESFRLERSASMKVALG